MSNTPLWAWITLGMTVAILLAIDLFAHRGEHGRGRKAAIVWSIIWVAAGLLFNVFVWLVLGADRAQEYLAAYAIEKGLSLDNLFVFLIIFQSLNIPKQNQHTVLAWGIFGALVFRAIFIFLGVSALESYEWVVYFFAAILLWAAWRTFRENPAEEKQNPLVTWLSRHLPVTDRVHGDAFTIVKNGKRIATPLLVAIVAVELTDVVFAVDSVPAALSISHDRFVVYASNAFAILGLRALYLVVAATIAQMRYLHYGLAAVLAFAAVKIVIDDMVHIPPLASVGAIVLMIGISVWASYRSKHGHDVRASSPEAQPS